MKQYINFLILTLSITCNLQASLPVQYWNDNVHKPKSTIHKHISLTEKCKQTVAMIKERKTVNLEKSIPLLMEVYTKEIHTLPEAEFTEDEIPSKKLFEKSITSVSKLITGGPAYEACKDIIKKEPLLKKRNISLYYTNDDDPTPAKTTLSIIQLKNSFIRIPDASKLDILHHELQHLLNGDNDNRTILAILYNECPLSDLQQTSYVRAILKSNIRNSNGQNLQDILNENKFDTQCEISRYKEFRADTRAIQNMHCPLCVEEKSMCRWNDQGYQPDGYINRWQYQPRIDQLKKQGTICQHHYENGEQIDTSICDSSTLVKRLEIIQK